MSGVMDTSKSMEYQPNMPAPVAKQPTVLEKYETLWVTQTGEFLQLPTQDQAKEQAKKFMEKFKPGDWWAQKVSKFKFGKTDFYTGYIKRDFSKGKRTDMSTTSENEMWLGRIVIGTSLYVTDTRPQSETMGERIPQTIRSMLLDNSIKELPILGEMGFYSYHPVTKETTDLYKKMTGETAKGLSTTFVYVLMGGGRNVLEYSPERFWKTSIDDALDWDRNIRVEQQQVQSPKNPPPSEPLK